MVPYIWCIHIEYQVTLDKSIPVKIMLELKIIIGLPGILPIVPFCSKEAIQHLQPDSGELKILSTICIHIETLLYLGNYC